MNDAPIAYSDAFTFPERQNELQEPFEVQPPGLLDNDVDYDFRGQNYDPESLQVDLTSVTIPGDFQGSLQVYADGSFDYLPPIGWTGHTTFTYRATDGVLFSDLVTVHLFVQPVAPQTNPPPPPPPVTAVDDEYEFAETNVEGNVLDNDEGATYAILRTPPVRGRLVPFGDDGGFIYDPDPNYWDVVHGLYDPTSTLFAQYLEYAAYAGDGRSATANLKLQGAASQVTGVDLRKWDVASSEFDPNTNTGGGKAIFPDKTSPTDPWAEQRRTVQVIVTTSPKRPNVPLRLHAVDVDDPSSNQAPLDDETKALDNRGGGVEWLDGGNSYITDAEGKIAVAMYIHGIQPGNNFRVFATTDLNLMLGVGGVPDDSPNARIRDANGNPIENTDPRVSPLLTVWRRLHVELDHMGPPGPGERFAGAGGIDPRHPEANDDVLLSPYAPSIALMKTNYQPAYIKVVDELDALNKRKQTRFVHNLEDIEFNQEFSTVKVRDVMSETQFWVVQIVGAYEGPLDADADPVTEPGMLGFTPPPFRPWEWPNGPCFIFLETMRDLSANTPRAVDKETLERRSVVHESAHRFNMYHFLPEGVTGPYNVNNEGIFDKDIMLKGSDEQNKFTNTQLHIIRGVDHPE